MNQLQEIVLHKSGIDFDEDIEEIIFNIDRIMQSLKSGKINKEDRIMLSNAVNIVYLAGR